MSYLLAIDPGIAGCGIACMGAYSNLVHAAYVPNPTHNSKKEHDPPQVLGAAKAVHEYIWRIFKEEPARVVFEWPRIYSIDKQKGDPNDLPALVGISMALCGMLPFSECDRFYPYEWKGQMKKKVTEERAFERLEPAEVEAIVKCAPRLMHNVHDAIGIGLKAVGRFERRRVYPR